MEGPLLDEEMRGEGWEPCGEKEVKRVLCKVLLRVKETKRMVKKKALGAWLSEEDQHERKDR